MFYAFPVTERKRRPETRIRVRWTGLAASMLAMTALHAGEGGSFGMEAPPPLGPPAGVAWTAYPAMTDEFDGDTLDAAKWWDRNPGWKGRRPALFRPENVAVEEGELRLTSRRETIPGAPEGYHDFTTATVHSKATVKYGYFEIRARALPSHISSAFWFTRLEPETWTEIDVFEISGGSVKEDRQIFTSVHIWRTPGNKKKRSSGRAFAMPWRPADDFHVYGLLWTPERLVFTVDGYELRRMENKECHQDLHLLFDSETFPNWFGLPPDDEPLPAAFRIDYVRAWAWPEGAKTADLADFPRHPDAVDLSAKPKAEDGGKPLKTLELTGKWQQSTLVGDTAAAAQLKAHPLLKVDITVPGEAETDWFMAKLAVHAEDFERVESPKWLVDRRPGKDGFRETLAWDLAGLLDTLPDRPAWFKIELVSQGGRARTVQVDAVRFEGGGATVEADKPAGAPATAKTMATPYPDHEKDFPGKGPVRKFAFMQGERDAFWKARERDRGAVVFVGDSNIGAWRNLAEDFPGLKVANRGVGGDTSRNVLFRFREDVLDINPAAVVIMIGGNDLTAHAKPETTLSNVADMLAMADKAIPGLPVAICSVPPNASPKAPTKAHDHAAVNEGLRQLAEKRPNTAFCDLHAAMSNGDGSQNRAFFAKDQVHMNRAAHARWAELLKPVFAGWRID